SSGRDGVEGDDGVLGDVEAELPAFLAHVQLLHARRRHHLEAPHQLPDDERQDGQRQDDPRAAAAAHAEGQEPEVHLPGDGGVHAALLLQEPLRPELLGVLPQRRVVGQPPRVHHHLGSLGDGVPAELGLLQVHVRHQQRDRGVQPQRLLDHGLQVSQLVDAGLGDGLVVAEHVVDLGADLALHRRVVDDLGQRPLDGPERRLDGG
ncbi:Os02g0466900, partial [Oryza sativa Japonica Group]